LKKADGISLASGNGSDDG